MDRLHNIKEIIESMTSCHHKQILNIINKGKNIVLSENSNGVFINLTDLDEDMIFKLEDYIRYVNKQQLQLLSMENKKNNIKNSFFGVSNKYNQEKNNKEKCISTANGE